MNFRPTNIGSDIYHVFCVIATMVTFIYCIYQFYIDDDVSVVEFQEFDENLGFPYPSVSLCFHPGFMDDKSDTRSRKIDINSYWNYLAGNYWHEDMLHIPYDDVTKRIEDYFLGAIVWSFYTMDEGWVGYLYLNHDFRITDQLQSMVDYNMFKPKFYTSFRGVYEKCLTFDIPNDIPNQVFTFELFFNNSVFEKGIRPIENEFGIKIHFPNQCLTSRHSKYSWKDRISHDPGASYDYTMHFVVEDIIVRNRRNKKKSPCNVNWKYDDQDIMKNAIRQIGCQPLHWPGMSNLPNCSSKEQMKKFAELDLKEYKPPCKQIKKVMYAYEELDHVENSVVWGRKNSNDTHFRVKIQFDDSSLMEIKSIRAYSFQSLIGNAGGYLGLFTGYSILQLPGIVSWVVKWVKASYEKHRKQ